MHAPGKADLNLYAYVSGRTLVATDPIGLTSTQDGCATSTQPEPAAPAAAQGGGGQAAASTRATPEAAPASSYVGTSLRYLNSDTLPLAHRGVQVSLQIKPYEIRGGHGIPGSNDPFGIGVVGANPYLSRIDPELVMPIFPMPGRRGPLHAAFSSYDSNDPHGYTEQQIKQARIDLGCLALWEGSQFFIAGAVAGLESAATSAAEGGSKTVFRVLRPDENPALGLFAKNPSASYSIEGHILNGSRKGWASQYISTTTDLSVAQKWAMKTGNRIVSIDLGAVQGRVFDLSTEAGRSSLLKGITARNFARGSSEVLIQGSVPPIAVSPVF